MANLRARLAEAREQGWGGEIARLEVSIAAAGQKLAAMDQLAARHQVTHLGMPDFRPRACHPAGPGLVKDRQASTVVSLGLRPEGRNAVGVIPSRFAGGMRQAARR